MAKKLPKRAVTLALTLEADTPADMVDALNSIAVDITLGKLTQGASGSPSAGYSYEYQANPGPTHDEYVAALNEYLKK